MSGPRRPGAPQPRDRRPAAGPEPDTVPIPVPVEPPKWWQQTRRAGTQPWYVARRPEPPPPSPPPAMPSAPSPPAAQPDRSHRRLLIGSAVAVLAGSLIAAVILVLRLVSLWQPHGLELDVNQAELGVQQVLTDPINGYGHTSVTVLACNSGRNPTVRKGDSFSCDVSVDGTDRRVTAVFSDDAGTYLVDQPR